MSRFKSVGTTEHDFFEERLSAYLDGELAPREQAIVKHHLESCPDCQWELDTVGQTIQWTRELPTLPVPRVFTVPVPAQPARSSARRWNLLPVLQGATALIAVLLVFAVAGDFMLGRLPAESTSDAAYQQEVASIEGEATGVVEAPAAAEVAPEAEKMVIETVVETVVVESEVLAEPTEAPLAAESISSTMPMVSGEAMVPEATPPPPADRATWESPQEAAAEEAGVPENDADEGEAAPSPAEEDAVAGGGEPPMMLSAPSAPITVTEPSTLAVGTELALAPATEQDEAEIRASGEPGINWLRVVQVSLGGILVLLAAATIFLTIERRKAR